MVDLLQYRKKSFYPLTLQLGGHLLLKSVAGLNRIPEMIFRNKKMGGGGHGATTIRGTALLVESQIICGLILTSSSLVMGLSATLIALR